MFKVGDTVRIHYPTEIDVTEDDFMTYAIIPDMHENFGEICTIKEVYGTNVFDFFHDCCADNWYDLNENGWRWPEKFLTPYEDAYNDEDFNNLLQE